MANPSGRSIVVKQPKPTAAQAAQKAAVARSTRLGAPGIGGASTDSLYGFYNKGPVALAPKPVATDPRGFVRSPVPTLQHPSGPAAPAAKPAVKPVAPKVKVIIHNDGRTEVHHASAPTPTPAATPSIPASATGGKYQTDASGRTDTTLNVNPKRPAQRAVATAAPAAPQTVEQQAQNLLDPVQKSIADAINQRVAAEQAAITGYSKDLASMMGQYAPAAKAIYGGAQAAQGAVDSALGSTLAGQGGAQNDALAAKLAQIDADPATAARLNAAAGTNLAGASGAFAARGASSLLDLIGRGASAQDYGAKLPGVAGLYGLQATKTAQSKGTTDTANAVAQLEQQLPGVVQTLKTDANQNKQLRFEHGVALLQANGGVVTPTIKSLLGGALPTGPTAAAAKNAPKVNATLSKAYGVQTDDQGKAIVGKDGNPIPYPTAGTTAPKVNVSLSKAYGILVDNTGSPILHQGKPVRLPSASTSTGKYHGLSAGTYQTKQAQAAGLARIAHAETPDGHPAVSWQQYLTGALNHKIPFWIAIQEGKRVYTPAEIKLGLIPGQGK